LKNHIFFLGNDSLKGRRTGTEGSKIAAEYIGERLKSLNLIPIAEEDSDYQYIPMHGSVPLAY